MDTTQLTPGEFRRFQTYIFDLCGISVPDNKVTLLSNRIRRRLRATKIGNFDEYFAFLKSPAGAHELEDFLSAITTNETSFFRTEKHFDWLRTEFIDHLRQQEREGLRKKTVRIWSAACSSGEEAYSIAICLAENHARLPGWTIEILGTDISEQALAKAEGGQYDPKGLESVPDKWRSRYFIEGAAGKTEVRPVLRNMVTFQRHNLMEPAPAAGFDCIFIRNVLIYFSRDSKRVVIDRLVEALAPRGYLVVGPSEGIYDMLGMLTRRTPFLYQKP